MLSPNGENPESPRLFSDYVELDLSSDRESISSFQSSYESQGQEPTNMQSGPQEWAEYVRKESKNLMKKCKRKARFLRFLSGFFAFMSAATSLYVILVSLATAIVSAVKETYDISDYVIIALSTVAVALESCKYIFKYNKRSIYFKQTRIQYRRIYRKVVRYLYTKSTDKIAGLLSSAYSNFDQIDLNAHKANFNKFSEFSKFETGPGV